ncbi:hypothetical protein F2981_20850 (plasmid) [Sinorhizobium meliloti]|nr:hypothetical protein [Sinorhizobium meliloti]
MNLPLNSCWIYAIRHIRLWIPAAVRNACRRDRHSRRPCTRAAVRRMFAISEEEVCGRRIPSPSSDPRLRQSDHRPSFAVSRSTSIVPRRRSLPAAGTGLGPEVWAEEPPQTLVDASLSMHDEYYAMLTSFLAGIERCHGRFVVIDVHSYNHRRAGPEAEPTLSTDAPDINIGTISMDARKWRTWSTASWRRFAPSIFPADHWTCAKHRLQGGRTDALSSMSTSPTRAVPSPSNSRRSS